MSYSAINALGSIIVLSSIIAALAIIFAAYMILRPGWKFAPRNGLILAFLIADLFLSLRVFEPSILRLRGAFVPPGSELLFCFVAPVLVFAGSLFFWPYMRSVNDDMPLHWTVWPQTFRAIGGIFLLYWAVGKLPGGFALPAGIGDLIVGLTAPLATRYAMSAQPSRALLIGWNAFGILDFVVAFATGLALDAVTEYPLVLIPGFLVPIALAFHFHSLRKLVLRTA